MKRWDERQCEVVGCPKVDAFLSDLTEVCKRHGLSISHEDQQGSFVIEAYSDDDAAWLNKAAIGRTVP